MTDREKAGLRGAVRRVVAETFSADFQTKTMPESGRREETAYLSDGRLESHIFYNPDGSTHRSTYIYDAGHQLIELRRTSATYDNVTHYTYDDEGRLVRVFSGPTDGPEATRKAYG